MATQRPTSRRRPSVEKLLASATRVPFLALLGAVVAALALLLAAPAFVVAEPVVVGQRLVQAEAIARASGLSGTSVFLVDSARVERAVLDLRPVASAHVAVTLPNVVTISVVERQPAAVWRTGGSAFFVDADGVVLGEAQGDAPPASITDLDARRVFVGGQVDRAVIARAAALGEALKGYLPAGPAFDYSRADGLAASLEIPGARPKRARVLFGQDDDVNIRVETWRRIASDVGSGKLKAEVVDLRIADRPYVK